MIAPNGAVINTPRPQVDSTLVKAIARAFRWQRLLEEGTYATMRDLAAAEKISPSYVSRLLRLTLLSPDIVEAVMDAREFGSSAQDLVSWQIPDEWRQQRLSPSL